MEPTDADKDKFKAKLFEETDENIRLNLDSMVYGRSWKKSLAEQELRRREEEREEAGLKAQIAERDKRISGLQDALAQQKVATCAAVVVAVFAVLGFAFQVYE